MSQELMEELGKIQKTVMKTHPHGSLTRGEFFMLHAIHASLADDPNKDEHHGIPMTQMSEFLKITKPAISQMVSGLEEKGLVKRIMNTTDRRLVYVGVTPKGEELLSEARSQFDQFSLETVRRLGEPDTKKLITLLKKLHTIFNDIEKEK